MAEIHVHAAAQDPKLVELLAEWLAYWSANDHMPNKMPNALHVRTIVALVAAGVNVDDLVGGPP